jgi:hypothetical protein
MSASAAASSPQQAQPGGRKRDTLFLDSSASIGGFSFAFTDGHLPVTISGTSKDSAGAGSAAAAASTAEGAEENEDEQLQQETLFREQEVSAGNAQVTMQQLANARKEMAGGGMSLFMPSRMSKLIDPAAYVQTVRRVMSQARIDAAATEMKRRKGGGLLDED